MTARRKLSVDRCTIERMDSALAFVSGHFVVAAKLVDMSPQRFRNIVNRYPCLKAKWGKKKRGRPAEQIGFQIVPHDDTLDSFDELLETIREMPLVEQLGLKRSLDSLIERRTATLAANGILSLDSL
jgi:hypothetical protein